MSRLDALPADQKSVLQLLLRQGKGYDDLSGLLRLDADEVRSRAYDALDTLGPGAGGLSAERRHEIGDWLLGQQDPEEAVATRAFVDGSTAGRVWAHGVARELEPLAGDRLPELPAEGAPAAEAPAAAERPPTTPTTPRTPPPPSPRPRPPARASRAAAARCSSAARSPPSPSPSCSSSSSAAARRQEDRQHRDPGRQHHLDPGPAAGPRAGQPAPRPRARRSRRPSAIVQFVDLNGQQAINAATQGLPTSKKIVYGLWFYNSPSQAKLIGGFDQTDNKGHLVLQGQLPKGVDIAGYKDLVITREKPEHEPDDARHDLPARVDPERRRRLVRRQQLAGVHDPGRIELALQRAQRGHAGVPDLGAHRRARGRGPPRGDG